MWGQSGTGQLGDTLRPFLPTWLWVKGTIRMEDDHKTHSRKYVAPKDLTVEHKRTVLDSKGTKWPSWAYHTTGSPGQ